MVEYLVLSEADRDLLAVEEVWGRERSHYLHERNTDALESQLASMPTGDWPERLVYLRGLGRDDIYLKAQSSVDAEEAQTYSQRDRFAHLLKTERLERDREGSALVEAGKGLPADRVRLAAALERFEVDRRAV